MNCTTVRRHLLASERPDQPAPPLAAHLSGCSACRGWHRRLVQLEQDIPRLAVPPSHPPAAFLEKLRHAPPPGRVIAPPYLLRGNPDAVREGGRQKLALAFALAASLAVFALGWWAWPRSHQSIAHVHPTNVAYENRLNKHLAGARTPQERVRRMADLADKFLEEASRDPARKEHLEELAGHFEMLGRDIRRDAERVPVGERAVVLGEVAARLRRIDSNASHLAVDWEKRHEEAARSLRRIAATAREIDRQLTELVAGEFSLARRVVRAVSGMV